MKFKTIANFILSLIFYQIIDHFNVIKHDVTNVEIIYILGVYFLIWTLFELLLKKDYMYIIFLYFMAIPIEEWIINKGYLILNIREIFINYNLIFLGILFLKLIISRNLIIKKIKLHFGLLLYFYFLFSVFTLFNTERLFVSLNGIIYGIVLPIILFLIISNILDTKQDIELTYKYINFSILFYNLFTFFSSFTSFLISEVRKGKVIGAFSNPNHVAFIQIIAISISLYFILAKSQKRYFFHLIISILVSLQTGSRSILICLIIILFLVLWKRYFTRKKVFATINFSLFILCIILIFLLDNLLMSKAFTTLNRFHNKGFDTPRFQIWRNTIDYIIQNKLYFLGIGLGNYDYKNISAYIHAHNSFLHLTTVIGLIGSLLFHWIIILRIKIVSLVRQFNLFLNIPRVILLNMIIFFNINAYVPVYHRVGEVTFDIQVRSIYLWIFIAISYFIDYLLNKEIYTCPEK